MKVTVGIVEQPKFHVEVIRNGWVPLPDIELIMHATNGWLLKHELENTNVRPDIMLIDASIEVLNGVETTQWLRQHCPSIKLIAMSIDERGKDLRKMLKAGCCGFFYKTSALEEFANAIRQVYSKGFYNPERNDIVLRNPFRRASEGNSLNPDEQRFLDLACSELSYEEILTEMNLTQNQSNRYIDALFRKFHVHGRNGLVLEALRASPQPFSRGEGL